MCFNYYDLCITSKISHDLNQIKNRSIQKQINHNKQIHLPAITMLHELLLAMLGKPGSIIKQTNHQYHVDPSVSFFSSSEIQVINSIVQVGFYYSKIRQFISNQITSVSILQHQSVYRKAMANGLTSAIAEYENLIENIEKNYIESKYFTLIGIKASITKHQVVFEQVCMLIDKIAMDSLGGGCIVDLLWQMYWCSNEWMQQSLDCMLVQCHNVFLNQVTAWILHGEIIDIGEEFFIHRVHHEGGTKYQFEGGSTKYQFAAKSKEDIISWDMYTLQEHVIPFSILSLQFANKLLFIGKSVNILKSSHKISILPTQNIISDLKPFMQQGRAFSKTHFEEIIQKIRRSIANQMIKLIIGEQNLLKELQKINNYYLMFQGDFYLHFLEELKLLSSSSLLLYKDRLEKKINQSILQNILIRLNLHSDLKKIRFEIKAQGFIFTNFSKNFSNLIPVGKIDLIQNKVIRMHSEAAVWHRTKQIFDQNFTIVYSFSFRNINILARKATKQSVQKNEKSNSIMSNNANLSLIIQNNKQIGNSLNNSICNLQRISEYIGIKVGFEYRESEKNYVSMVQVVYKSEKKFQKEVLLSESTPKKINFMPFSSESHTYQIKVAYQNDELKVWLLNPQDKSEMFCIKENLRINNYLALEMGRAYVGFISTIHNDSAVDLEFWEMVCKNVQHSDHFTDLTVNYNVTWPVSLILNPDLMENFTRIHKFLFPIRQVQLDLEGIWIKIARKIKEQRMRLEMSKQQKSELNIFERRLSLCRAKMSMVVNNLWSYLQADVALTAWMKLKQSIACADDFEKVIVMINQYVRSIQIMFFFNVPKIQRMIHELVRQSKQFVLYFNRIVNEEIDEEAIEQFQSLESAFDAKNREFYQLLKDLSKTSSSAHLFHLTQRIEVCNQQQRLE